MFNGVSINQNYYAVHSSPGIKQYMKEIEQHSWIIKGASPLLMCG